MKGEEYSDFYHFDRKRGKRVKNECKLLSGFYFARHDFQVVEWKNYYFVCLIVKGDLISVWNHVAYDESEKILPGEVMGLFRKEYLKHNITEEMMDLFVRDPLSYEETYRLPSKRKEQQNI